MITARVLAIAGGGGANNDTQGGAGGAGGFRDVAGVNLSNFSHYDIVVGKGVSANGNGENSYIKKQEDAIIESPTYALTTPYDETIEEIVNVSSVSHSANEIWVKIVISNTDESDYDGAVVSINGVTLFNNRFNGTYYYNVKGLIEGDTNATLKVRGVNENPTVNFTFLAGYLMQVIGGGRGGQHDMDSDGDAGYGREGGSGGGGGGETGQSSSTSGQGGEPVAGQGFRGGNGNGSDGDGGGGGGAGGAGSGPEGGDGEASDITGSNVTYAGGGHARGGTAGAGQDQAGGGGNVPSGFGKDGLFIVRYTLADVTHSYTGGVITNVGGDRIHTFTESGVLAPLLPSVGALML